MALFKKSRPAIPKPTQHLLWLRAGGRCEFRGCNEILYEDNVTKDPINGSNIAHIISWTKTGPRGDEVRSPKLATDISNLMLLCPRHTKLIDSTDYVKSYPESLLHEMKEEHEALVRDCTEMIKQLPKCVIELIGMIQGQKASITPKEEAEAMLPFYPEREKITIDVSDYQDYDEAKTAIRTKVTRHILERDGDRIYVAFIMAAIPLGCYLGYLIGNKIPVKTFQHFRDTEDWKWRNVEGAGFSIQYPAVTNRCDNVKLIVNVSGIIELSLTPHEYPVYSIQIDNPRFDALQSWNQVLDFRKCYREVLDRIRNDHGENVTVHLFLATPNPINSFLSELDISPTIILYDKSTEDTNYNEIMHLHDRVRMQE